MDDRAQSQVLGAALVFSFLVLLLGTYQVFGVPQQNEEVEFKHSQEVREDMVDLRSGLIEAAGPNEPTSISVSNGVQYPMRYLTLNPPPVSGTLRTEDAGTMSFSAEQNLENVCGRTPSTKFFEYLPSYNEYDGAAPVQLENSFVYRSAGGDPVFDSGQVLIQGSQITIIPIVGDISQTSVGATTVDLVPARNTGTTEITSEGEGDGDDFSNLTVPSQLDPSAWEDEVLADQIASGFVREVNDAGEGKVDIVLEGAGTDEGPESYTIRCTAVGLGDAPDVSSVPENPEEGGSDNAGGFINPINPVTFQEAVIHGDGCSSDSCVNITFDNQLSTDVEVVQARFTYFYQGAQGSDTPGNFDPPDYARYDGRIYEITGPAEQAGNQTIASEEEGYVNTYFAQGHEALNNSDGNFNVEGGDWYNLRLTYKEESDDRFSATYFIPPVGQTQGSDDNGPPDDPGQS